MSYIYLQPKLLGMLQTKLKKKIAIIGRGGGKSHYLGVETYQCARMMPRSLGGLYGPTYSQILTKILPSMKKALINVMGMREDRPGRPGHFVIGRKPPTHFKRPINEVEDWKYLITFFNGSGLELISQDRPNLARGGSYDYHLHDEAVLEKQQFYEKVVLFTLRGNRERFGQCPKHGMQVFVSSQAHHSAGYWVEDMQFKRDEDGEFLQDKAGKKIKDPSVFAVRGTSWDNVAILGEETIVEWQKSPDYDIEVMSERPDRLPNGFYPAYDPGVHKYFGGAEYDYDEQSEFGVYVKKEDAERQTDLPLIGTADFNASLNTLLVFQEQDKYLRGLHEFYEKGTESIAHWLQSFVDYYRHHGEKTLFLYGDPGGNKIQNFDNLSTYDHMKDFLGKNGWAVKIMVLGRGYPNQKMKFTFLNDFLRETLPGMPKLRMHFERQKYLHGSLRNAPINDDFTKDKRSELQEIDQRLATHPSDAFDYLMFYRYFSRPKKSSSGGQIHIGGR